MSKYKKKQHSSIAEQISAAARKSFYYSGPLPASAPKEKPFGRQAAVQTTNQKNWSRFVEWAKHD